MPEGLTGVLIGADDDRVSPGKNCDLKSAVLRVSNVGYSGATSVDDRDLRRHGAAGMIHRGAAACTDVAVNRGGAFAGMR
jgi:hypothetical protein